MALLFDFLGFGSPELTSEPSNLIPSAEEVKVPSRTYIPPNKWLTFDQQLQPQLRPLQQFTLFSSLPVELQQTIWDFACVNEELEQRVLPIAPNDDDWELRPRPSEWYHPAILVDKTMSTYLKPALLHTCSYTRGKLLKVYVVWPCATSRLSPTETQTYTEFKKDGRKMFVKPKTDIFYLSKDDYMSFWFLDIIRLRDRNNTMPGVKTAAQSEHANVVQPIACFAMSSQLYRTYFANVHRWRSTFPNIEELTVAHGFPYALREITAGSGSDFRKLAMTRGQDYAVSDDVRAVISSRADLRKRLGILEYADQRERNRQADLVKPLRFMYLGTRRGFGNE